MRQCCVLTGASGSLSWSRTLAPAGWRGTASRRAVRAVARPSVAAVGAAASRVDSRRLARATLQIRINRNKPTPTYRRNTANISDILHPR